MSFCENIHWFHSCTIGTNYIGGTGAGQREAAWRIPLALQLVPAVILGVGILFMPFSPRYDLLHRALSAFMTNVSYSGGLSIKDVTMKLFKF